LTRARINRAAQRRASESRYVRRAERVEKYSRDVCEAHARAEARRGARGGRVKMTTGTNACDVLRARAWII
jgi:hypothetical protein